jgi:glycosyltransferase involved in cell wall biosynthesis
MLRSTLNTRSTASMSTCPRVAVLMPVYNAEPFLQEALDSILRQTFGDFELLAVDNASTDGSRAILEKGARLDHRVRVVTCEEPGIVNALNAGLTRVHSEFVARMDADDIAHPGRLALQVQYLRSNEDVIAVGCRCLVVDEEGDPLEIRGSVTEHDSIQEGLLRGRASYLCHSAMMFRARALAAVGGYRSDVGVSEDLDLYLRLAEIGRLSNAPELAMTIRRWPESTTKRQTSEQFAWSREKIINDAFRRRGINDRRYVDRRLWVVTDPTHADLYQAATALEHGFTRTARKYTWRAVRRTPGRLAAWKMLARTLLGMSPP